MKPPAKSYFPPKPPSHHQEGKHPEMEQLIPPSKAYLTPKPTDDYEKNHNENHQSMEYLQVPSKNYLPPTLSDSYEKAKHPEKHLDMEHLHVPTKNYLPPTLSDSYERPKSPVTLQVNREPHPLHPHPPDGHHKLNNATIAPLLDSGLFSNGNVEIKALSKDYLGQGT